MVIWDEPVLVCTTVFRQCMVGLGVLGVVWLGNLFEVWVWGCFILKSDTTKPPQWRKGDTAAIYMEIKFKKIF